MATWLKKLPFLNRKRYIVLKAYTRNSAYLENVPIKIGSKECPVKNKNDFDRDNTASFATCYGRLEGLNRSATVEMPTDLYMSCSAKGEDLNIQDKYADKYSKDFSVSYDHVHDKNYVSKNLLVSKVIMPWMLQEETGINFVVARHIRNMSPMIIPTGVCNYKFQHALNVFNCIPKQTLSYDISMGDKLVSIYPLSEKKLVVESYYDPEKYSELRDRNLYQPFWKGSTLKLLKRNNLA